MIKRKLNQLNGINLLYLSAFKTSEDLKSECNMKAMLLLQPGRLDILHMNTVCIVRTVFEERAVDVMSPCKSRHVSRVSRQTDRVYISPSIEYSLQNYTLRNHSLYVGNLRVLTLSVSWDFFEKTVVPETILFENLGNLTEQFF